MRIIGHIDHPTLKITVFKTDNRLSIKFESGLYEQTYKFRAGSQLESFEDIRAIIDAPLLAHIESTFIAMHQQSMATLARHQGQEQADEFDEII